MLALRLLMVVALAGALAVFGFAGWVYLHPSDSPFADATPGPPLDIAGPLDDGMVARVRATVRRAAHPPTRVFLRSGGGSDVAARDLAGIINRLGAELVVPDQALCSSACVMLLADVAASARRISPTAWLRVHGLSEGGAVDDNPGMAPWIRRLSANWLIFMEGCRSRPLLRRSGLTMQWQEVQRLDADPRSIDCDAIAFRTLDWTTAHLSTDLYMTR
jgi:hypothetical protein